MSKFKMLGVAVVAVLVVSMAVAAMASAVEFLLALFLLNNVAVTTPVLVDMEGELTLISLNGGGLGLVVEVLCSGIFDGFVEENSKDLITELLTLEGGAISSTELVGTALTCINIKNCAEPLVTADNLPVETEAELLVEEGTSLFADLLLNAGFYVECMALKISELCSAAETAVELTNEANGTIKALFSEAFQELAGLKLGNCTLGGPETAIVTSEGNAASFILDAAGPSLAVSSE